MHPASSKDSTNISITSSNGIGRVASNSGISLMNGNGQLVYRRSPVPAQQSSQTYTQPQSFDTLGSPSTVSYTSEGISENINSFDDESINDLSQKFELLQRQIEVLTETQTSQDERYKRTRQENDTLLNRIHSLEDQIREVELNAETRAKEDERRFRETMAKQIKVQSQECEQHLHSNYLLQQELFKVKNDLLKNEALLSKLKSEKECLELEIQEKNTELTNQDEEIHKLKLQVKHLKDEESVKSNIISILNEELEDNNNSRSHQGQSVSSSSHITNFNQSPKQRSTSSRRSSITSGFDDELTSSGAANLKTLKDIDGLEASLAKLRDENKRLKETNEELQAQLLNVQLEEGRSLIQDGDKSYSLADEMGDIDVQKLMQALKEQQEDNARLRKYMDAILSKIIEKNPEILDTTLSSEKNVSQTSIDS